MDYLIDRDQTSNTINGTLQPQYNQAIQQELVNYFKQYWIDNFTTKLLFWKNPTDQTMITFFNDLLISNGAFMAGSFIQTAINRCQNYHEPEIYIYIPKQNYKKFTDIINKLLNIKDVIKSVEVFYRINTSSPDKTPFYVYLFPSSHDKKRIYLYLFPVENKKPEEIINKDINEKNIIQNKFFFSFDDIWYDGKNVFAIYPDHVKEKTGILKDKYYHLFEKYYYFLMHQVLNYLLCGYKLEFKNPKLNKIQDIKDYLFSNITDHIISNSNIILNIKDKNININYLNKSIIRPHKNNKNQLNLSYIEDGLIEDYSGADSGEGAVNINKFLYTKNLEDKFIDNIINRRKLSIYKWIQVKFPRESDESISNYNKKLMYYYTVLLYNTIYLAPKFINKPFKVFRGVSSWHLPTDTNNFYYINSFMSTSINKKVTEEFGDYLYIFYIHPTCSFMDLRQLAYTDEEEILFTPYHRCYFINQSNEYSYRTYVIFPTDLQIPTDFITFMDWKNKVADISKPVSKYQKGGKLLFLNQNILTNNTTTKNTNVTNKRNILTIKRNKLKNNYNNMYQLNKKVYTNVKYNNRNMTKKARNNFNNNIQNILKNNLNQPNNHTNQISNLARFTAPLPSFRGNPPTPKEIQEIQNLLKYFKE
jgi:hypothetical protein